MIKTVEPLSGAAFVVVKNLALDRFQNDPRWWFAIAAPAWLLGDPLVPKLTGEVDDLSTALHGFSLVRWHESVNGATWFAHDLDAVAFALAIDGYIIDTLKAETRRQWHP